MPGGKLVPCEDPTGRLAVPDQRVSHDIHVIAQTEVDVGVGRAKIVTVGAFARLDHLHLRSFSGEIWLNCCWTTAVSLMT